MTAWNGEVVTSDDGSFFATILWCMLSEPLISCVAMWKQFHLNQWFTMMHHKWLWKRSEGGERRRFESAMYIRGFMPGAKK